MSENEKLILAICLLIGVYFLSRKFQVWRIKRTYIYIINDLKKKDALDTSSSVELPYARKKFFRFGTKDFRPKAVEYLVLGNIVGKTENGKYYLKKKDINIKGMEINSDGRR